MILEKFRNASNGFFTKILFGAIIFSFCSWGVGDIIRNYSASKTIFSIDKYRLTVDQFLREYSQEKQRIRNIGTKPLSDEEMKRINIPDLVLQKLLNEAIMQKTYEAQKIIISKKSLMAIIKGLPEFQNNGRFDPNIYQNAIRHSNLSEAGFLDQIRNNLSMTQLIRPFISGYKVPNLIKNMVTTEFEAKNNIVIAKVSAKDQIFKEKISENDLLAFYSKNQERYKKPEKRDIAVLIVDYSKLAGDLTLDNAEVQQRCKEFKDSYKPTEKRDFERFVFDTKEDADKAWRMINGGTSTEEIIKKFKPDMEKVYETTRPDFPEKIGKEIFEISINKTSEVYGIGGKYYIYKLVKVHAAKNLSDKEIETEIRKEMQSEKLNSPEFYSQIKDMRNKIDDGFGSGKTIENISKETGMEIKYIKDLDKSSADNIFKEIVKDEDTRGEVVDTTFSTDEHQATTLINSRETDTLA